MTTEPDLRLLSLGAGVQSSTTLLLSAMGELPKIDAAIFADTGWEPEAVYQHLDRLEREVAEPAGIPIYRVSYGSLPEDLLDPNRMAMIPAYTLGPPREAVVVDTWRACPADCGWLEWHHAWDLNLLGAADQPSLWSSDPAWAESERDKPGECTTCDGQGRVPDRTHTEVQRKRGMLGRKCTQTYKLRVVLEKARELLGAAITETQCAYCEATGARVAPWRAKRGETEVGPCSVCRGAGVLRRVGQPPAGVWAEQWIGFSTDEVSRVSDQGGTRYSRPRHPLIELDMSRDQCEAFLQRYGWTAEKSACIPCPYHGNATWRRLRDTNPKGWAEACAFDEAYRHGPGLESERYLHPSCVPLAEAPIDGVQPRDLLQVTVMDAAYRANLERLENGDPDGCSPWGCRSGEAIA